MILLTRIIALIVAIAVGAQSIQLSWTPHPENRWLRLVYYCGTDFVAVNIFDIDERMASATVHKVRTPDRCSIAAEIIRSTDGSTLVDEGSVGESGYVVLAGS